MSTNIPGSLTHNPYDFANPVTELAIFAGRGPGLSDVDYYLNEALSARPIHLALTGDRSAGKTSMLNMVAAKALGLGFLVVRVDLNEGDSEQIEFFARLYDAVLTSVVSEGGFGGPSGTTWNAYRGLVDTGTQAPGIPLSFPSHLVAAIDGSRRLSIALLSADLKLIQQELNKRVVVILDECDVLSKSRIALQTLRNLFNDLSAFMFVIAGTPNLFTVFDDVFSPIARQFKKLPVAAFADESDTQECIAQPLKTNGIEPERLFERWPNEADEIHRLTGGRPYEIRLLCHTMFKRMQQGAETKMVVNLEALDAVRLDIEQSGVFNVGRSSRKYLELSDSKLRAIGLIRAIPSGSATQAFLVHELRGRLAFGQEQFQQLLHELVSDGVLSSSGENYTLVGDQFDEVYLRYLAASRRVYIPAFPATVSRHFEAAIRRAVRATLGSSISSLYSNSTETEFNEKVTAMLFPHEDGKTAMARAREWAALHKAVAKLQINKEPELVYIRFSLEVGEYSTVAYFPANRDVESQLESETSFAEFQTKIERLGGNLDVSTIIFDITSMAPIDQVAPRNAEVREVTARSYDEDAYEAFRTDDFAGSLDAFEVAYGLSPTASRATSAAFLALHVGKWESVIEWADNSVNLNADQDGGLQHCAAAYDRALALVMLSRSKEAVPDLERALTIWDESNGFSRGLHLLRAELDSGDSWQLGAASLNIGDEARELKRLIQAQPAT